MFRALEAADIALRAVVACRIEAPSRMMLKDIGVFGHDLAQNVFVSTRFRTLDAIGASCVLNRSTLGCYAERLCVFGPNLAAELLCHSDLARWMVVPS